MLLSLSLSLSSPAPSSASLKSINIPSGEDLKRKPILGMSLLLSRCGLIATLAERILVEDKVLFSQAGNRVT